MQKLLALIKQVSYNTIQASNPLRIQIGTITKLSPFTVFLEHKISLTQEFFIQTETFKNRTKEVGDKLILLRIQGDSIDAGGQYVIIDRLG